MKLFRSIKSYCHSLGMHPPESNQFPFNWRYSLIIFNLAIATIISGGFFILDANTVREYGDSFYVTMTSFTSLSVYLIHIFNMRKVLKLMENFDGFIQGSKSKSSIVCYISRLAPLRLSSVLSDLFSTSHCMEKKILVWSRLFK